MEFKPTRLSEYTDETILAEIRRVATLAGSPSLSTGFFKKHARVDGMTVRRRFGGWREALEKAGLGHLYIEAPPVRISRTLARTWTNDQILDELKRVASKLGNSTLTVEQFGTESVIGRTAVRNRFGSWHKALESAGLLSAKSGRRYNDAECFENLLNVWTLLGRQPMYREMGLPPSVVSGKAYVIRWGTWNKAIHAFVDFAESDSDSAGPQESQTMMANVSSPLPRSEPADKRDIQLGLRYRVLMRDRSRCVLCGRSPATDLGCELHFDHIVPFSRGGKTVFENLRVLCKECNLGKGNRIESD